MPNKNSQPTYKRQRFLLSIIGELKGGACATEIQKLTFLYSMERDVGYYDFLPYKSGPYSFQLAEDITTLCRGGYISITRARIKAKKKYQYEKLYSIPSERGDCLIRKAYREYPYYAINSEIVDRLFRGNEAEVFRKGKEQYRQDEQVLFTIGYEGKSVEKFLNALIQNGVRMLIDVRKNPISRKFGFSKEKLKHITEGVGIKYMHIPDLGIESEKRTTLDTIDDYKLLFRDYEKTLSNHTEQLDMVYSNLCSNVRVALMCFEKDPQMCHRHVIRDYVKSAYKIRSIDL